MGGSRRREPLGIPCLRESEPVPDLMVLLSHLRLLLVYDHGDVAGAMQLHVAATAATHPHALHPRALVGRRPLHRQVLERLVEVVLPVRPAGPHAPAPRVPRALSPSAPAWAAAPPRLCPRLSGC